MFSLKQLHFLDISSQNYAKASQIFQNIAKLKSVTMHMISDFMHFDTIAFRQKKKSVWKVDGYNIRSVYIADSFKMPKFSKCHNSEKKKQRHMGHNAYLSEQLQKFNSAL